MSASISDVESDDWNVISGEWRSYLKSEGDDDTSDIDSKKPSVDHVNGVSAKGEDDTQASEDVKRTITHNEDGKNGGFDFRASLSKLVQMFLETRLTFMVVLKAMASFLFIYYTYLLTLDSYYNYKVNNMIGTIDELPANPKFIELHMKKCNGLFSYYQDVLDSCVDSSTDDNTCLTSYFKLVQKSSKFCSWDPEKIYKQQQVHVIYRHGRQILGKLTDTSIKLVNSVGDGVVEKSTQQWESLKRVSQKLIPFYKKQLSMLSQKEKEFSSFLAKRNKDFKIKQKWRNFVSENGKYFARTYNSLKSSSPLVWESFKGKTLSGVRHAGNFINRENIRKVYDSVYDSIFSACGQAYNNLLAFTFGF